MSKMSRGRKLHCRGVSVEQPIFEEITEAQPPADGNIEPGDSEMRAPPRKRIAWDIDYKEQETIDAKPIDAAHQPAFQGG